MESKTRYTRLYDFSPVGYATLSAKGLILKSNLTLADMLLTEKNSLINKLVYAFIAPQDQGIFYQYKKNLLE